LRGIRLGTPLSLEYVRRLGIRKNKITSAINERTGLSGIHR